MNIIITDESVIIEKARQGLALIASGEERTIEGWLMYGAALLEGRKLHPSDKEFGKWVVESQLASVGMNERVSAMWAAEFPEDFAATRKAFPNVRTVRGLHSKFKSPTPATPKHKATSEDILTMQKLNTLAQRGATAGERQAAQSKLNKLKEVISVDDKVFEEPNEQVVPRNKHEAESLMVKTILKDLTEKRAAAYIGLFFSHYCDGDFNEMLEFLDKMKKHQSNNL